MGFRPGTAEYRDHIRTMCDRATMSVEELARVEAGELLAHFARFHSLGPFTAHITDQGELGTEVVR